MRTNEPFAPERKASTRETRQGRFVVHQQTLDRPTSDPIDGLSDLIGHQAAAAITVALQQAGHDPAGAAPWGHGVVGMVRSAADWWLRADRPMLRSELAAHLTDLAWAGLSGVVTHAPLTSAPLNSMEGK